MSSTHGSSTTIPKGSTLKLMEMEENLEQSIKYIVYLTINKINKKIYIGVHQTNTPYKFDGYLGCGIFINKPSSYQKSKTLFQRAVNKYGPDSFMRITLYSFDTEEEAYQKEIELVNEEFLQRKDVYNTTLGGNKPPITCIPVHQYDLKGNYITSYSSIKEASEKLKVKSVNVAISIKEGHSSHGWLWSYDKVEKLEQYDRYNKPRKVAVYSLDGNLIKIYDTVRECKKDYCGCVHVLNGTRKKCKNCTFKYID